MSLLNEHPVCFKPQKSTQQKQKNLLYLDMSNHNAGRFTPGRSTNTIYIIPHMDKKWPKIQNVKLIW